MRPGRPTSHIKPSFITWDDGQEREFYPLDTKGNLQQKTPAFKEESPSAFQSNPGIPDLDFSFQTYDIDCTDDDFMFPL